MRNFMFFSTLLIGILFNSVSFAQWPIGSNATVVSGFQFGPNYFYYLQNAWGTYKTSAMPDPLLTTGQTVYLLPNQDEDEFTIPIISQNYFVSAYVIDDDYMQFGTPTIPNDILPYHLTQFDILVFSSDEHLETVSNYLEYLEDQFYQLDFDDIAAGFHNNFSGFYSYYDFFNDAYDDDYIFEDEEALLAMHDEWFIDDYTLQTVFNSRRMIGIDKKIFFWFDYNTVLSVSIDDEDGILDLFDLYGNPDLLTVYLLKPNITLESSGPFTYTTELSTRSYEYNSSIKRYFRSIVTTSSAHCDNYTKSIRVGVQISQETQQTNSPDTLVYYSVDLSNLNWCSLEINWGDGSQNQTNSYSGQAVSHTYPAIDMIYFPTTAMNIDYDSHSVYLVDGQGTSGTLIQFNTNGLLCSKEEHREPFIKTSSNETYRILCEHWFEPRFLNTTQMGAKTSVYKKNQNGSGYKKFKGRITAEVDGILYEQTNCNNPNDKKGHKTRKKRHSLQKRKTWVFGASRSLQQQNQSKTLHRLAGFVEHVFWFVPC